MSKHEEKWDFYPTEIEGQSASVYLDLGFAETAPVKDLENLFRVSLIMNQPNEQGLSSNAESEKLFEIEDLILKQLTSQHKILYVGRLTHNGKRDFYFYCGDTLLIEKTLSETLVRYPDYEVNWATNKGDNWEYYFIFLYPTPRIHQSMLNRRVIDLMEEKGDSLGQNRQVDHWIYFKSKSDHDRFEQEILKMDFLVSAKGLLDDSEDEYKWRLIISREDKVGLHDMDEYVLKLWDLAQTYNGVYDGWETQLFIGENE